MDYYSPDLGEVGEVQSSVREVFAVATVVVEADVVGNDVVGVVVVPLVRIDGGEQREVQGCRTLVVYLFRLEGHLCH